MHTVRLLSVSSSTVTIAPHCPPFEATEKTERVYWGALGLANTAASETRFFPLTFPDNNQVEHAEVGIHDAPTDRLALALAGTAGPVARVALAKKQAHTAVGQDTLFHGEALLVVASTDADNVALGLKIKERDSTIVTQKSLFKDIHKPLNSSASTADTACTIFHTMPNLPGV